MKCFRLDPLDVSAEHGPALADGDPDRDVHGVHSPEWLGLCLRCADLRVTGSEAEVHHQRLAQPQPRDREREILKTPKWYLPVLKLFEMMGTLLWYVHYCCYWLVIEDQFVSLMDNLTNLLILNIKKNHGFLYLSLSICTFSCLVFTDVVNNWMYEIRGELDNVKIIHHVKTSD